MTSSSCMPSTVQDSADAADLGGGDRARSLPDGSVRVPDALVPYLGHDLIT